MMRREPSRRPRSCTRERGKRNLFIKIPGTQEGLPGDRGGDFRRRSRQRHAAVLARAISGGGRGLSARRRAAHRGGPQSGGRIGRLGVRQPLGCRGGGQGAGGAVQPSGHRHRRTHLQGLPRPAGFAALAARRQCRRPAAAPAVGEHRHEGSEGPGHPLCEGARRAVHGQYDAGRRRSRLSPTHGEVGDIMAADGGDCEAALASFAKAGIDVDALAARLQDEGAKSFVKSWNDLMSHDRIEERGDPQGELISGAGRSHARIAGFLRGRDR